MGRIVISFVLFAALAGATSPNPIERWLHFRVPMRDRVLLDTNVFYPSGGGRYPAILLRTPYGKGVDLPPGYSSFLKHGYAVVLQDVRGTLFLGRRI